MITKSDYVSFWTCPKSLWLKKYKKDVGTISPSTQKRMLVGIEVGKIAQNLFSDFIDVTTLDESNKLDLIKMVEKTKNIIENKLSNVICEAAFLIDDLYCAVDILKITNDGLELYEVKSSTSIADYHVIDSSYQYYVLTLLGYKVNRISIITINSSYVRQDKLDITKLFNITDITDKILKNQNDIEKNIEKIRHLYKSDEPLSIFGKHCNNPHNCEFKSYCYKDIPSPSIFDLAGLRKTYEFYNKGIIKYEDLFNSNFFEELSENCKMQLSFELENKEMYVDKENLKSYLNTIKYPLYLLDFETFQPVIPLFKNTTPYSQIPFQYSLHILYENGFLEHKEFLGKEGSNPTYELAKSLINDIPKDQMIMAYNMSFEKTRIKELSKMYPLLSDELNNRLNNFIDLMIPFQKKYVYKKEFQGSYSIKYILPGLFPNEQDLDYHNLDIIHNGDEAMTQYEMLLNYDINEREKIKKALLKYCELDTYAMYKILLKLYELAK